MGCSLSKPKESVATAIKQAAASRPATNKTDAYESEVEPTIQPLQQQKPLDTAGIGAAVAEPVISAAPFETTTNKSATAAAANILPVEPPPPPVRSILDPADITCVLEDRTARTVGLLSDVEVTWLQRAVRTVRLPNKKTQVEASAARDKYHVLHEAVVAAVLPTSTSTTFANNAYTIMLHCSTTVQEQFATSVQQQQEQIEQQTTENGGGDTINNTTTIQQQQQQQQQPIQQQQAVVLPPGASFTSFCFVLAIARRGSRQQQLRLLMDVCLDSVATSYAARNVSAPIWLLPDEEQLLCRTTYDPPTIPAENLRQRLLLRLAAATQKQPIPDEPRRNSIPKGSTSWRLLDDGGGGADNAPSDEKPLSSIVMRRLGQEQAAECDDIDNTALEQLDAWMSARTNSNNGGGSSGSSDDTTTVKSRNNIITSKQQPQQTIMTWQDVVTWADSCLDDAALNALMHRIFLTGLSPSPTMERNLVQSEWESSVGVAPPLIHTENGSVDESTKQQDEKQTRVLNDSVFGGIGGMDGGGGLGHGVLYCIDKSWWDAWVDYVGWSWVGETPARTRPFENHRPGALSTERLLDNNDEALIRGVMGSYEQMKLDLERDVDYMLVPPRVWNVLYELYGGGPPLPRMVRPIERNGVSDCSRLYNEPAGKAFASIDVELDGFAEELDDLNCCRVMRLPESLSVVLHPWVLHVHLCDPVQPYRRGDAGLMTIRVMATPDQPLWRLYAEIIARFPLQLYKAFGTDNTGMGRLWKKIDFANQNQQQNNPVIRYGPWNLLCKSRHASIPIANDSIDFLNALPKLVENWISYADNATVESSGLSDQNILMLECAVMSKSGELAWPREAAAKAGHVRRLADEDQKFRNVLQGVDENGVVLLTPINLIGMKIDAMDSSGRWYSVIIENAEIKDETMEIESNGDQGGKRHRHIVAKKMIHVDFSQYGGHLEWIDVESDRVAVAGRFTSDADGISFNSELKQNGSKSPASHDPKPKLLTSVKKNVSDLGSETVKICMLPGLGGCGLTNLGNTCYINSAIQCLSYVPLLRSYLLSVQYKSTGDLNKENPLGTGGKLLEECADLLRTLWSAKSGEKSPTKFRAVLGKINAQFSGADQQDAQEFLNYMFDVLHEDSNRVRKKPYVESIQDDWVTKTSVSRVGDEAWRRFLRRNRSVMTDIAMGQVLNTVTCPVCNFSSKNFDPFNLLSIPIPTVADVIFQCTVYRRASSTNCPYVLNKPRKGEKKAHRFRQNSGTTSGPPSDLFVTEEYTIALSRLADSGDLRLQIQNACGIPAHQLRLCRAEIIMTNDKSVVGQHIKVIPLTDKEGPCSSLTKKRQPDDKSPTPVTLIVAFESTLRSRFISTESKDDGELLEDTADEEDELDIDDSHLLPTAREKAQLEMYLGVYGDELECRLVDTNPLTIAKAVSRSLWPRTEEELKLGLRVDAKDHRGNWYPGNVVEIVGDRLNGADPANGESALIKRKVRVHFDNFLSKWDEMYTIEHFIEKKEVRPLYSHAAPRSKPTEFLVHHRYTDKQFNRPIVFGQSFFIQCQNEWSNARAGAHILAQASRFLKLDEPVLNGPNDLDDIKNVDRNSKARRLYDRTQTIISDLIDLLVDCDREYIRLALGVSEHNLEEAKVQAYRNPSFDPTSLSSALVKKVANLLLRLPFEVRVCTVDTNNADNLGTNADEIPFPFSLIRTIGNYMNARHAVILHWRDSPVDKRGEFVRAYLDAPVMYVSPRIEIDKASANILMKLNAEGENDTSSSKPGSAGIDLGVCLTEFCKVQNLTIADSWRCPHCKGYREGRQSMTLWRLPDLMTFHIKRFNMSARWREKITTKVNFPLTGLDLSEWCHEESPTIQVESSDAHIYDLIGVVNHYGSMTGGHYVATCKATPCGRDGTEEVGYSFNGVGAAILEQEDNISSVWRLGRPKAETNPTKVAATVASQAASESAEPLWLQFDDELVEPIPPQCVVSEMAYVLFYRRRRMTPSNIAKYCALA